MSDVKTKVLFAAPHVRAEALADGQPLKRPIYFKYHPGAGTYMTAVEARNLARDLFAAAQAADGNLVERLP